MKVSKGAVAIDADAVRCDARLDGKFVLTTNTDLPAGEIALTHKSLWRVERIFREEKSTLEVRPIFHHRDDTSIGHIVASFLALRLEVDLQHRLDEAAVEVSWPDLMRNLGQVQAVTVDLDGQRYRLRTDLVGVAHHAFSAAGVRVPGSAFVAEETRQFLQERGVHLLLSPPRFPSYNGACEAGIGSLATRAHHASARNGRPGEWTCDDLEAARREANETARPWGVHGPTPEEVWMSRAPITEGERAVFASTVVKMREEARRRREKLGIIELARHREDAIECEAIARAWRVGFSSSGGGGFLHPLNSSVGSEFRRGHNRDNSNRLVRQARSQETTGSRMRFHS